MHLRFIAVFAWVLALFATATVRAEDEARFTRSLSSEDLSATGLAQLNSDQVAILDALVRRDAVKLANMRPSQPRPARFSDRITADERRNAGLSVLSEPQLSLLDEKVQRFVSPLPSSTAGLVSGSGSTSATNAVSSAKIRRELEVHGSVTLMYGVGSHGYSEKGGAMVLSVEDPASGLALAFGYSEVHANGGRYFRNCGPGFGPPIGLR